MAGTQELVQVHVDFNDMDSQGQFFVLHDDASEELRMNSQVTLYDAEGNSALGAVVDLRGDQAAVVAMIAGSWRRAPIAPPSFDEVVRSLMVVHLRAISTLAGCVRVQRSGSGVVGQSASPSTRPQTDGAVLSSL